MSLESTHPYYSEFGTDWTTMRDLYKGERHVKARGTVYLPPTQGMILDGMNNYTSSSSAHVNVGREAYNAYRLRALFPDYVKEAVESYIGLLHQKPPTIELPPQLEDMRERATVNGESLELLLRRINEEQLVTGRCGLLLDLPPEPDPANPLPYIALYIAEAIRNWDDGEIGEGLTNLNLVILDESGYKRDLSFEWTAVKKYRVLMKVTDATEDGTGVSGEEAAALPGRYMFGVFSDEAAGGLDFNMANMKQPLLRGTGLEEVPFVFVNSKDIVSTPDNAPLMGLGNLALAIYRGEADYRQNLFMQSQDTLLIVGNRKMGAGEDITEGALRTGAGSVVELDAEPGAKAEYVGVSATGLPEQRISLENDHKRAETRAGQLINARSGDAESGEALKVRVGAQTATLVQIATTGAAALELQLKLAARWVGADEDKVVVTPNLEFSDFDMSGENLVKLMTARTMGAPISKRSIHDLMVDQGLTKLDYETELDTIEEENASDPLLTGTMAGGDPEEDEEDDDSKKAFGG